MILLISFWTKPIDAANIAVVAPIKVIKLKMSGAKSYIGEHLTTKKTPAVTIVAAWIKAETGVGPSMASGNQVCKKICADLIAKLGANSIKDMGKVMGELKKNHSDEIDFAKAGPMIKDLLNK